ncbi:MAG: hypothetical protein HUK22_05370 [Thermoguttaceae bacterium]|nr:hypothetical protein [Thermoguttaceae bacterium]
MPDAKFDPYPTHYMNPTVDLSKIKHVAFDMDGTIYKGGTLFPFTKGVFDSLESLGIGYTYLTNNSSKSCKDYLQKILSLGLKGSPDNIATSASATFFYLKNHYPDAKKIYVFGTASLREEFVEHGYEMADEKNEEEPDVVVVAAPFGWDDLGSFAAIERVAGGSNSAVVVEESAARNQARVVGNACKKLVAFVGVDDLLVVETDDALLIAKKGDDAGLRRLVARLESAGLDEYL